MPSVAVSISRAISTTILDANKPINVGAEFGADKTTLFDSLIASDNFPVEGNNCSAFKATVIATYFTTDVKADHSTIIPAHFSASFRSILRTNSVSIHSTFLFTNCRTLCCAFDNSFKWADVRTYESAYGTAYIDTKLQT